LLLYFKANIHSALYRISGERAGWSWHDEHREAELLSLRKAIRDLGFNDLPAMRRAQILTNLGNGFNHLGRTVEALEIYDRALLEVPTFGMALGNRGLARESLAIRLFDAQHRAIGAMLAHDDLRRRVGRTPFGMA
jgi:hypothetical protein